VEVLFLESPHRMDIACSLPARTAEAAWRRVPLDSGRLQTLHRPRSPRAASAGVSAGVSAD
jgi:hypothetical protein